MAKVYLDRRDLRRYELPSLCMKCGAPSDTLVQRTFRFTPGWVYALVLVGLLPFLIVAIVLTKRVRIECPMCDLHQDHWWSPTLFIVLGFVFLMCLLIFSLVLMSNPGLERLGGILVIGALLGLLGFLFVGAIVQSMLIRASEITDREVTLIKVHPRFADAVEQEFDYY